MSNGGFGQPIRKLQFTKKNSHVVAKVGNVLENMYENFHNIPNIILHGNGVVFIWICICHIWEAKGPIFMVRSLDPNPTMDSLRHLMTINRHCQKEDLHLSSTNWSKLWHNNWCGPIEPLDPPGPQYSHTLRQILTTHYLYHISG